MDEPCREVLASLALFLDGECPERMERTIVAHLHDCPPCLGRADFERELRAIIATKCKDAAPSGLLDRVLRVVWSAQ